MSEHTNTVELVGFYGSDESHALSAWTSTSRDLTEDKRSRMGKLLTMLAQQGHHTPFEKSTLHFLITCDTASHIHVLKHRIGVSVNGESARYKEHTEDKFYIPADWPEKEREELRSWSQACFMVYHETVESLVNAGIDRKRAKESARFYLPYNSQVILDVSFNFRSFMHFQSLRNKPSAQDEIEQISQNMLDLVRETGAFDLSLEGFGY